MFLLLQRALPGRASLQRALDGLMVVAVASSLLISGAGLLVGLLGGALGMKAWAGELPPRNFWIEFRWVSESEVFGGGVTGRTGVSVGKVLDVSTGAPPPVQAGVVSTAGRAPDRVGAGLQGLPGHLLQVANGAKGALRLNQSVPVQWAQEFSAGAPRAGRPLPVPVAGEGPGLSQQTTWLQAGQTVSVQPRWAGRDQPVALELQLDSTRIDPAAASMQPSPWGPAPALQAQQTSTTVLAPLGQWVTVAITPETQREAEGAVTSLRGLPKSLTERQILQVRVRLN